MTNIDRAGSNSDGRSTGAVPKSSNPNKANTTGAKPKPNTAEHNASTLNRISKSSLQWLLVNKWLPLWAGESQDYKIIDFNFMFSRQCEGCDDSPSTQHQHRQGMIRFNGDQRSVVGDYIPPAREYPTMNGHYPRIIRSTQQLSRLNETYEYRNEDLYDRPRQQAPPGNPKRYQATASTSNDNYQDPFRNWQFNFDNNTFRPAGAGARPKIRRITDGTFPTMNSVSFQAAPHVENAAEIECTASPRSSPPPEAQATDELPPNEQLPSDENQ